MLVTKFPYLKMNRLCNTPSFLPVYQVDKNVSLLFIHILAGKFTLNFGEGRLLYGKLGDRFCLRSNG